MGVNCYRIIQILIEDMLRDGYEPEEIVRQAKYHLQQCDPSLKAGEVEDIVMDIVNFVFNNITNS